MKPNNFKDTNDGEKLITYGTKGKHSILSKVIIIITFKILHQFN